MKIRDRVKELRRVRAGDLIPNPKNWRTHPKRQQEALKGILREVGYADALLVRETKDGLLLVDGHLRADTTPDMEVPVLVLDLNDAEADMLLATLDPLAALAESNMEALRALTLGINTDSEALQELLARTAKLVPVAVDDVVPEPPKKPKTKPGNLYVLREHRLLCGDSTSAKDVGRLLGKRKPFIMATDPPYGVEYHPAWRNEAFEPSDRRTGQVKNDHRVDWTEAYKLFPGHVAYVWHADWHASQTAINLNDSKFEIKTQIIWRKPIFVVSRGHYHWQHEPCWYATRSGGSAKWCGDRSQSTVWDITNRVNDEGKNDHGTQKPVECMARPIRNHGGKDDDVYDPFLGSGTTIIAAEQLGRRCYGLEISPAYCDVIVQRWQALTGKKAILTKGS